uniref:ZAD domain-containing protein n=1 Tax=Anopheles farauti TaxID=69004 RepID=A0A182Q922_9DIPT
MNSGQCRFCLLEISDSNRGVSLADLKDVLSKVFTFPIQCQGEQPLNTCAECTSIVLSFFHYSERVRNNQYKLLAAAIAAQANGSAGEETPGTSKDVPAVAVASGWKVSSLAELTRWMNSNIGIDPANVAPEPMAAATVAPNETVAETGEPSVTVPNGSQSSPAGSGNALPPPSSSSSSLSPPPPPPPPPTPTFPPPPIRLAAPKSVHVQYVPGCYMCAWVNHGRTMMLKTLQSGQSGTGEATKRAINILKRKIVLKYGCASRT